MGHRAAFWAEFWEWTLWWVQRLAKHTLVAPEPVKRFPSLRITLVNCPAMRQPHPTNERLQTFRPSSSEHNPLLFIYLGEAKIR
jgi:hypothetical protein